MIARSIANTVFLLLHVNFALKYKQAARLEVQTSSKA
jgi:hypothetical protein